MITIPLLGDKAAPIANLTPMGIALGIMGVGAFAFLVRLIEWRRSEARARHSKQSPTETP